MTQYLLALLALLLAGGIWQVPVSASGSISAGGGINPRDACSRGKALTFKKLVCPSCPIQRGEVDRARPQSLKNSLEARDAETKPGTPDDEHIEVLCPGSRSVDCADKADEQELIHYYLTRRYKL